WDNVGAHGGFARGGIFMRDDVATSTSPGPDNGCSIGDVLDGTSNTLMIGEMSWSNNVTGTRYRSWVRGCDTQPVCAARAMLPTASSRRPSRCSTTSPSAASIPAAPTSASATAPSASSRKTSTSAPISPSPAATVVKPWATISCQLLVVLVVSYRWSVTFALS